MNKSDKCIEDMAFYKQYNKEKVEYRKKVNKMNRDELLKEVINNPNSLHFLRD